MNLLRLLILLMCIKCKMGLTLSTNTSPHRPQNLLDLTAKTNSGIRESINQKVTSLRTSKIFRAQTPGQSNGRTINENIVVTLLEVFQGPLAGRNLVLHMDTDVESVIDIDNLLSRSENPIYVSRSKETELDEKYTLDDVEGQILQAHFKFPCKHRWLSKKDKGRENDFQMLVANSTFYRQYEIHPHITAAVFVYITSGKGESIRWFETNSMAGLLVFSLDKDCDIFTLRKISLTHQTASVTLLCQKRDDQITDNTTSDFEVSTWLPFHPKQRLHSLGLWSPLRFSKWKDFFIDRFASFHKCPIFVSSDDADPPYFYFNAIKDNYDGIGLRMMEAISQWANFKTKTAENAEDGEWGSLDNGSWIGLLGEIYRREKDVVFNYFSLTEERAHYFDSSVAYFYEGFGFSIKIPPPLPRWLSLIYPFTPTVWGGILAALVLSSIVFYFLPQEDIEVSPLQSFLIVAQSLMNQGVDEIPSASHFRLFFGIWCLSAYIIVLSYTCNLIAVLTVPAFPRRIRDVAELAKSDLRICMLDYGEFVPDALATSEDPDYFTLGSKMDLATLTDSGHYGVEECIEYAVEGSHSHVESYSYLKMIYILTGKAQEVYYLDEQIYEANLAFFFPKNTPWKYKLNIGIRRLVESGLVNKWYKDISEFVEKTGEKLLHYDPSLNINGTYFFAYNDTAEDASDLNEESNEQALALAHLQGPFYILLLGSATATLIFFLEIIRGTTTNSSLRGSPG